MSNLKLALLSTVCLVPLLTLSANPALAAKAGVTAAVNPQAVGTAPGSGVRTIVLGEDVVTNEKIDTTGGGLVQILLADGTTFTVGPNSSLTIDKFVYDPEANTAQVTASLAKGVFRFIGGRTSKTDGGVTINTPVGTVGIRGAVADISLTPNGQTLKAQIDLLFGKEVTLSGPGGLIDRIFKAGYSILIGADGHAQLVKTPPGAANVIQTALAGKPGTHGGAGDGPTDGDVKDSDVPKGNSDLPPGYTPPDLEAIELATIDFFHGHDDAKDVLDNQNEEQPGPIGFAAGQVVQTFFLNSSGVTYEESDGAFQPSGGEYEASDGVQYHSFVSDASDSLLGLDEGGDDTGSPIKIKGSVDGVFDAVSVTPGDEPTASVHTASGDIPGTNVTLNVTEQPYQVLCSTCSFLQWGTWDASFTAGTIGYVSVAGTAITGDFPGTAAFNNYAASQDGVVATYSGHAAGYEYSGEPEGDSGSSFAHYATGDLDMTWDFGNRQGQLDVTNFGSGHRDLSVAVDGSGGRFSGSDGGGVVFDGNVDPLSSFGVTGAFAKSGSGDVAGGVMGNFTATQTQNDGPTWSATGVFGGARDTQ